jgi:hypothetical protein
MGSCKKFSMDGLLALSACDYLLMSALQLEDPLQKPLSALTLVLLKAWLHPEVITSENKFALED